MNQLDDEVMRWMDLLKAYRCLDPGFVEILRQTCIQRHLCKPLLHLPRVERSSEKILIIFLHFFRFLCSYVFNVDLSARTGLMKEDFN